MDEADRADGRDINHVVRGYHAGEVRVQTVAGVRHVAARRETALTPTIPEVARLFLEERQMVILSTIDPEGRPWASVLTGPPGFARALDAHTVRLAAEPIAGDPLAEYIETADLVGVLTMDLEHRRRLRVNGRMSRDEAGAILIRTEQVFSNCSKYIQARRIQVLESDAAVSQSSRMSALQERHRDWIRSADTFFVATVNPGEGADASHRGGPPGFVSVAGNHVTWPDYAGNSMFGTLGNLERFPRAGLIFLDFERGHALQLTGRAGVDWDALHAAVVPGAERLVEFDVDELVETHDCLPVRFELLEYSPLNPTVL
jgi:uncharacterized protein